MKGSTGYLPSPKTTRTPRVTPGGLSCSIWYLVSGIIRRSPAQPNVDTNFPHAMELRLSAQ